MTGMHADADVLPDLDIGAPRVRATSAILEPAQAWHDGIGRLVARGGSHDGRWWMEWPGLGTFTFGKDGPVAVHPVAPGLEPRIRDSFLRGVLPVVLLGRGFEALHASAVEGPHGVVALCATSGTGKSTLALALSDEEGLTHWADDTVVYHLPDHRAVTLRLPCVPRIADVPRAVTPAGGPAVSGDSRPLARIYHLARDERLDPREPVFVPVRPAARFERLLAHAHPFEMGHEARRRAFVEALLEMAQLTDCWECRFAPSLVDLPSLAAAVRRHIETVRA
jgi:hypothetical protein